MKKGLIATGSLVCLLAVAYIGTQTLGSVINQTQDATYTYTATFSSDTPAEYRPDLVLAIQRSVKTKLAAMGAPTSSIEVQPGDQAVQVIITAPADLPATTLDSALAEPYDFALMRSVPLDQAALIVNDTDGYGPTTISGSSLYWVESAALESGMGAVRILLDESAQAALESIYAQAEEQSAIGVFVRNQLIAKLLVTSEEFDKDIRILNVPDASIAQIFADDMNVGRYVQFSQ